MFDLLSPFIGSMARHALTLAAGYLVAAGLLPAAQANGFVGACLLFVGIGWSAWHKLNQPGMLARLQARQATQNVAAKEAQVKEHLRVSAFPSSPLAIVLALCAGMALLAAGTPSHAQTWPWQSAPVKRVHKHVSKHVVVPKPVAFAEERMNAGLLGLLPSPTNAADQLWANVSKLALDDLQFAKVLADQVTPATAASKSRSECYGALVTLIVQQSSASAAAAGGGLGSPTTPHTAVITKFEQLAQLSDALQSGSPVQVACAPVAQAIRLQFTQFLSTVLAGGLSLGKLGVLP